MKDKLLVEIDRGFEVEMRKEAPERDPGGRKKIKQTKVGLENTGVRLLDFRDNWVAVEDQHVEMRQRSDSEDEVHMEGEEVQRKRKRSKGPTTLGYDVVALYPSLKLEFKIKEIDRAMVLRIETKKGEEKQKAMELRNISMPLIIFMLEHQF